jgi:hypothetical protein
VLEKWAGARATERRLVDRARIVLMAGMTVATNH